MTRPSLGAGWPALAGLSAFVVGLLMLGGAGVLYRQAQKAADSSSMVAPKSRDSVLASVPTPAEAVISQIPRFATHLDDVGLIFAVAKEQAISLGPIDYRTHASVSLPVVLRSLDLRVEGEYPKLKSFVAELLKQMPHMYLEEMRVEQGGGQTGKLQATLKLSFTYQTGREPNVGTPTTDGAHEKRE